MSRTAGQDIGDALERNVAKGCELYLARRVARIEKVPTPIKQLKRSADGHTFSATYVAEAHTDFFGVWLSGPRAGQAIVVECKATLGDRLVYSRIETQQRAWLDDTPEAYLLVDFVAFRTVRLVRWRDVEPRSSVRITDGWAVSAVEFLRPLLEQDRAEALSQGLG